MKLKKFKFNYKGKGIIIDVKILDNVFSKALGLMFKRRSPNLLFVFRKARRRAIHSFFCRPFIAIWFLDDKIVGIKLIKKWKLNIIPDEKFNKLLEISINDKNFQIFSDEEKV